MKLTSDAVWVHAARTTVDGAKGAKQKPGVEGAGALDFFSQLRDRRRASSRDDWGVHGRR
jgi:hypothetical protein